MVTTTTYLGKSRGHYRCLFFLLLHDYIQAQQQISRNLRANLERFARDTKDAAALVAPFPGDIENTRAEVSNKRWPNAAYDELLKTPSLLMIDRDFDKFDPMEHPWLQIKIPLTGPEDEIGTMLQHVTKLITSDTDDIFRRVRALVLERERSILRTFAKRPSTLRKIFGLRPDVLGISVDLWELGDAVMRAYETKR